LDSCESLHFGHCVACSRLNPKLNRNFFTATAFLAVMKQHVSDTRAALRNLEPNGRLSWFNALNEADLRYLAAYHHFYPFGTKAPTNGFH
jgi:hypothetical protein